MNLSSAMTTTNRKWSQKAVQPFKNKFLEIIKNNGKFIKKHGQKINFHDLYLQTKNICFPK